MATDRLSRPRPRSVIVMGVSGAGKTTLGQALADSLGWEFHDADQLHSQDNITRMASGKPLGDSERLPWLKRVRQLIESRMQEGCSVVVACSALKESYRTVLTIGCAGADIVYIRASPELVKRRLLNRSTHFMKESMVESQFADLEEPNSPLLVVESSEDLETTLSAVRAVVIKGSEAR